MKQLTATLSPVASICHMQLSNWFRTSESYHMSRKPRWWRIQADHRACKVSIQLFCRLAQKIIDFVRENICTACTCSMHSTCEAVCIVRTGLVFCNDFYPWLFLSIPYIQSFGYLVLYQLKVGSADRYRYACVFRVLAGTWWHASARAVLAYGFHELAGGEPCRLLLARELWSVEVFWDFVCPLFSHVNDKIFLSHIPYDGVLDNVSCVQLQGPISTAIVTVVA